MNEMRWMLKMAQWARNPPPMSRVKLVFAVILICVILVGIEKFVGWPDWMTVNRGVKMP